MIQLAVAENEYFYHTSANASGFIGLPNPVVNTPRALSRSKPRIGVPEHYPFNMWAVTPLTNEVYVMIRACEDARILLTQTPVSASCPVCHQKHSRKPVHSIIFILRLFQYWMLQGEDDELHEQIYIGAEGNTRSGVFTPSSDNPIIDISTPNILHCDRYLGFYVNWFYRDQETMWVWYLDPPESRVPLTV